MPRVLVLLMGAGILVFGLMIGAVMVFGRILPTQELAYISSGHGHLDLVLLDLYHRIPVNIFKQVVTFSWSPDGEQIVFSNYGESNDLYIMDVYGHHIQRLTNNQASNVSPSWSPDGKKIVFSSDYAGNEALYVMPVDCQDTFEHCTKRLTPDDNRSYVSPVWSPNGKQIAFVSMLTVVIGVDSSAGNPAIYVMDANGEHIQRLTKNSNESYTPAWSPDGRYLAYLGVNRPAQLASTMIMDTECSDSITCIHSLFSASTTPDPSWSNDGNTIAFAGDFNGNIDIYITDMQGHYLQRVTSNEMNEGFPRWRP